MLGVLSEEEDEAEFTGHVQLVYDTWEYITA